MKIGLKLCLFLFLVGQLASCGKVRSERNIKKAIDGNVTGIGTLQEPTLKTLSSSELMIANRICTALKNKRVTLEANPGTVAYFFGLEKRNCKNKVEETKRFSANVIGVGRELEYMARDVSNYFTNVITDQHEALNDLCTTILAAPDAKNVSNVLATNDKIYSIAFTINAQKFDTVNFLVRTKNKQGSYVLSQGESVSVATDATQLGAKFLGVEKERSQYTLCIGAEVRTFKETWLGPSTYNL